MIINAKITKTPKIISFMNRLSNLTCMKYVITVATFTLAIIKAAATVRAPRWKLVTVTERKVSNNQVIRYNKGKRKIQIRSTRCQYNPLFSRSKKR